MKANGQTIYITNFLARLFFVLGGLFCLPIVVIFIAFVIFAICLLIPALICFLLAYCTQVSANKT